MSGGAVRRCAVRVTDAQALTSLRELYADVKSASPSSLFTYVNYPPTEYLDTEVYDVASFNVYLHRETDLRAYLARLQQIAGHKPLLLASLSTIVRTRKVGAENLRRKLAASASDECWS